jgi:hypothetical protein
MIKTNAQEVPSEVAHKIAHSACKNVPVGSILLDALKPLEVSLFKDKKSPFPLWFLAETERNVFLWRNGLSLIHAPYCDFWVHIDSLIDKRLSQLSRANSDNPFCHTLWGPASPDPLTIHEEKAYLADFKFLFQKIAIHADALCHVTTQLQPSKRIPILIPNS